MRLTLMTDYALRLLMHVARHPERLCTIAEIAQAHGISEAHLMKVTHQLARQGWIETVRGKGGGMRLAHAPQQISVGAVVRDMEPDFALVECLGGSNQCALTGDCRLTGMLQGALNRFVEHLDGFSLADLMVQKPAGSVPSLQTIRRLKEEHA
ncbi:MAG: Rrf2 family transcriptional regulator [Comamonas sp.]|jgi:Rrf2 family nitric oxide-sensitive transcriptional repressor|uniref:RrF2 family transcriptional regulator n=1 Tax=Comamonas sp. TaxID=34028 RepID=UPI00281FA826|nr:Rrf2 family transcriptional regulator [Comamonas sp.]MDR0213386.1 Rrf2 family transcriptional regulator [Comamonas sp.]